MKEIIDNKKKSAGRIINELARASHLFLNHEFKKYSIGHAQIRTLFFISSNKGLTQKDIAKHLNLDKSSITSQLNILEGNGYIKRSVSKVDARMQQIEITKKTEEILPSIKQVLASWTETLLKDFDEKERVQLFNYLERMQINAKTGLIKNKI